MMMTIIGWPQQALEAMSALFSGENSACRVIVRENIEARLGVTDEEEDEDKNQRRDHMNPSLVVDNHMVPDTIPGGEAALKKKNKGREKNTTPEKRRKGHQREKAQAKKNNRKQDGIKSQKKATHATTNKGLGDVSQEPQKQNERKEEQKSTEEEEKNSWKGHYMKSIAKPFPGSILVLPRQEALPYAREACDIDHGEFLVLWTDGCLLDDGRAGASVVFRGQQESDSKNKADWQTKIWRIAQHRPGISDVEQFAIAAAIQLAIDKIKAQAPVQIRSVMIFSDCCSAIDASCIRRPGRSLEMKPLQALVQQKAEDLVSLNVQLCLTWVPGHAGIEGNERAHHAAQAASYVTADAHQGTLALPQSLDDISAMKIYSEPYSRPGLTQRILTPKKRSSIDDSDKSLAGERNSGLEPIKSMDIEGDETTYCLPGLFTDTSTQPPAVIEDTLQFELPDELKLPEVEDFGVGDIVQELLDILDEKLREGA